MKAVTDNLKLIVMDNFLEFGDKVNMHLKKMRGIEDKNFSYMVPNLITRFSSGEGKGQLLDSVREQDLYILSDVGNYSCTYKMHGLTTYKSPDDHFQDLKRVISACDGNARNISVVMPYLYESRQHKKKGRESLDLSIALKELENLGVNRIITFDAHNKDACDNAIKPTTAFENPYPTYSILSAFIKDEDIDFSNLFIISPDTGAVDRARYYADMLTCDVGIFYKRRDFSRIENGKNPIVAHEYLGKDVKGKNVIVVDDMISSGVSMIEVAEKLKEKQAARVYLFASFALFSNGEESVKLFEEAYQKGLFYKLYTTNLTYVEPKVKQLKWFREVDCSKYMAKIINTLNKQEPMTPLLNGKEKILKKITDKKQEMDK